MPNRITTITAYHVAIPYDHGAPKPVMGTGAVRTAMDAVYLRVETEQGLTGWGECFGFSACPVTVAAIDHVVAPLALGHDASDVKALSANLRRRTQSMGLNGPVGFALSGLDIALWDIAGKAAGRPVYALLGANTPPPIPAYASLLRLTESAHVNCVCTIARDRGYRHIKLHERTVDAVVTARQVLGPNIALMVDTNCTFTPDDAAGFARDIVDYDIAWLEEPIYPADDYQALAELRAIGIPIAAGENLGNLNEVRRLIAADAVDIIQPDPCKMGGITEVHKALALARQSGIEAEPHSPYYGPGLIASLHLIAAMPAEPAPTLCEFYFADLEQSPIGDAGIPRDGHLHVPDGPGLGIDVDETILARYRITYSE